MGENRIKLGMSTDYLPIIDVGLYGTFLGDLWIKDEYIQDYKRLICEKAKEYMMEMLKGYHNVEISNVVFCSPQFYNYRNDWLEYDMKIDANVINDIKDIIKMDFSFFEYCKENFGSHEGFFSFMPYTKEKYMAALDSDNPKELAKAIGMFLTWVVDDEIDEIQEDFENDIIEYVYGNTDWEVMEDDE